MDSRNLSTAALRAALAVVVPGWLFGVSVANAVEARIYQLGDGGAIAPHVRLEFGSDNNPLRSNSGSKETVYLRVEPRVSYIVQQRNNRLVLGYTGDYYQYFEEYCRGQPGVARPGDCLSGSPTFDKASYQDHALTLDGFLEVSSRIRATMKLKQEIDHQPLGTGLSGNRGTLDDLISPEYWNRKTARAELSYGAFQARGEVRAGISFSDRELRSERAVDLSAQSDTSVAPYAQLLYRVGTRTQVFAGFGVDQVRGSIRLNADGTQAENLERDITRMGFGIELDESAVTSGRIFLSSVVEDFLGRNRDLKYLGWDVSLIWRPRRYSTVTIGGGRQTESGLNQDAISLTSRLSAEWEHYWQDRLSSRVVIGYSTSKDLDQFSSGSLTSDAEDDSLNLRLEGNYNLRRWLDVGGFLVIGTRDGRGELRDYERTVFGITANGTI